MLLESTNHAHIRRWTHSLLVREVHKSEIAFRHTPKYGSRHDLSCSHRLIGTVNPPRNICHNRSRHRDPGPLRLSLLASKHVHVRRTHHDHTITSRHWNSYKMDQDRRAIGNSLRHPLNPLLGSRRCPPRSTGSSFGSHGGRWDSPDCRLGNNLSRSHDVA